MTTEKKLNLALALFLALIFTFLWAERASGQEVRVADEPKKFVGASTFLIGPLFSLEEGRKSLAITVIPAVHFRLFGTERVAIGFGAGFAAGWRRDFGRDGGNKPMLGLTVFVPVTFYRYQENGQHYGVTVALVLGHPKLVRSADGRLYLGVAVGYSVWR